VTPRPCRAAGSVRLCRPHAGRLRCPGQPGQGLYDPAVALSSNLTPARCLLAVAVAWGLGGCGYGADFDYPSDVRVPNGASVVATDTGMDDDDPLRSRQQVVDLNGEGAATAVDFYQKTYTTSDGWEPVTPDDKQQELCLVNRSDDRFTEVVEMFPYTGRRVEREPDRYLITISRLGNGGDAPCGSAWAWTSPNLV
jgi:hypothetical protein